VFSSRRIEKLTYTLLPLVVMLDDHHPDHDTICRFRRNNAEAIRQAFTALILAARDLQLVKLGTISIDGTHLAANASRNRNVTYARARQLDRQLEQEIDQLLEKAEQADRDADEVDGQTLPEEAARARTMQAAIRRALEKMEEDARQRAEDERPAYEAKQTRYRERNGRGSRPVPPDPTPRPTVQTNLTDPDSRLMKKTRRSSCEQSYNAQAAVDADGSMLVLSAHVTHAAGDVNELLPALEAVPPALGPVRAVLADTGYCKAQTLRALEAKGIDAYIAVPGDRGQKRRKHDYRPEPKEPPVPRVLRDPDLVAMKAKLQTDEGRSRYRQRQQTVEPVFGIIKSVMGFRRFLTRGLKNVQNEWTLVTLAYNMRRLATLTRR
jgi:hypothetical protein